MLFSDPEEAKIMAKIWSIELYMCFSQWKRVINILKPNIYLRGEKIGVWGEGGKIIGDPSLCLIGQAPLVCWFTYRGFHVMSISMSIYISIYLHTYLSIYLSIYLTIYINYISVCSRLRRKGICWPGSDCVVDYLFSR